MTAPLGDASLGRHVAEAFVRAREAMRPHDRAHADERLTSWLEAFETDMRDVIAPHLTKYLDHPDVPAEVKQLFAVATGPEHQSQVGILFAIVGALAFPLVSAAMSGPAQAVQNTSLAALTPVELSPAEAALAAVRHTGGDLNLAHEAAASGMNAERFNVMVLNTGDSPAIGDLLLLYRRRQISYDRLLTGLRQSRLRDEWANEILELRFQPPSVGELLAGAVQGHLDVNVAALKAEEAGLDPQNWDWLLETAGRPPGTEMLLALLNRGFISEQTVRDAIRESDIKNKYIDAIIESRHYIPPVRSILPMLRAGAISDDRARTLLREHGVREEDIPAYIAEGHHVRTSNIKELSMSQLSRMYVAQVIDRPTAHARIVALGYSPQDADLILGYADDTRTERYVQAVIARTHNLYVAHRIDATAAHNALNADGVPPAAIGELFRLWDIERGANVAHLTVAQLQGALRRNVIDNATFRTRVTALGYSAADVTILAAEAFPPARKAPTAAQRDLSVSQLVRLFQANQLTETELHVKLTALGYDDTEAGQIITLAKV